MSCVARSPDGTRVAACGHRDSGYEFERATGKLLASYPVPVGEFGRVACVCYSRDGSRLLVSGGKSDGVIAEWDVTTGKQTSLITGCENLVESVIYGATDETVVGKMRDGGGICEWNLQSGTVVRELDSSSFGHGPLLVSHDGQSFLACCSQFTDKAILGVAKICNRTSWAVEEQYDTSVDAGTLFRNGGGLVALTTSPRNLEGAIQRLMSGHTIVACFEKGASKPTRQWNFREEYWHVALLNEDRTMVLAGRDPSGGPGYIDLFELRSTD